jgi:glutaredoxin-like protein NrdH
VKEFLSREGAAFDVKNVEEDHDAYTELLALGVRTVPLTVIGTKRIKGFDPAALQQALEASAGESTRDR